VVRQIKDMRGGAESYSGWRERCLRRAGFERRAAARIADDGRVDLHALLELTDRGCPPELAVRILAPLDDAPPPP
jgi:hypothetical protein